MKDRTPSSHNLLCSQTPRCVQWFAYLDSSQPALRPSLADLTPQERREVEQLQKHVEKCIYCQKALEYERMLEVQQRQALRTFLDEGEQRVPATVDQIMAALSREAQLSPLPGQQLAPLEEGQRARKHVWKRPQSSRIVRTLLAFAAAIAIILAGTGLFQYRLLSTLSSTKSQPEGVHVPTPALSKRAVTQNWSSLLVTRAAEDGKSLLIENYDPVHQRSTRLLPDCCTLDTVVDGVSHMGDNLLYRQAKQDQTTYALLDGQHFTLPGGGGNGVWSTDDQFIYTFVDQHVYQYDTHSNELKGLPFLLKNTIQKLTFFYQGYLYFAHDKGGVSTELYRVKLATGEEQRVAESSLSGTSGTLFWLNPFGTTIYYVSAPNDFKGTYVVNVDGTGQQMVVDQAVPAGYAADGTLIVMRQSQDKYQLVQLAQQMQVLVSDLAPGAAQVSDNAVAVAPYAETVTTAGFYIDGSLHLWSTDIKTQSQRQFFQTFANSITTPLLLIGWDRLAVPPVTK